MNFAAEQRRPTKHVVGMGVVLVLHIALGYGLVSGLARKAVEVIKGPIETKLIEEVKPPPPPPENLPPPPKTLPPPPPFVPAPEVTVTSQATAEATITTTQVAPPPAPPPAPVAVAPVETPPAPVPVRVPPQLNFNVCARPDYARAPAAHNAGVTGAVVVAYTMDVDGRISDARIEKSAGPSREHKQLDKATLEAVLACKGKAGTLDGKPERLSSRVEYRWTLD